MNAAHYRGPVQGVGYYLTWVQQGVHYKMHTTQGEHYTGCTLQGVGYYLTWGTPASSPSPTSPFTHPELSSQTFQYFYCCCPYISNVISCHIQILSCPLSSHLFDSEACKTAFRIINRSKSHYSYSYTGAMVLSEFS